MQKYESIDFKKIKATKNELEIELGDEYENILNPITHILSVVYTCKKRLCR